MSGSDRYNAVRDIAGDLDASTTFVSTFGATKMVVRLDGEDWVFVRTAFNVTLVIQNDQKLVLGWMVVTVSQVGKHDVQVGGGVVRGGVMEVTIRGVHGVPA
jgi:hypothetical protein